MLTAFDEQKFRAEIERARIRASVKKLSAFAARVESGKRGRNGSYERTGDDTYLASERSAFARRVPGYARTWHYLRLICPECDGYLVVCRAPAGKFAPCANYESENCGFSLGFDRFKDEKHGAILAHLAGSPSSYPYTILDKQRVRIEPENDEWFGRYYIGEGYFQTRHARDSVATGGSRLP
jgi:hypothetical protein